MTDKNLCFLVILLLFSCGTPTQKEEATEQLEEESEQAKETETPELSDLIAGQWKTIGNEGVVPNWLEFDSSTMKFYSWLDEESRPSNSSGSYSIVKDTLLSLFYSEYNEIETFGFDSISKNYLDIWSTGVSAGNLIYERTSYEYPQQKVIFFHLSEHEFDSVADLPDYQGLYEVSSDFGFYVSKVVDSLKNSPIKTEITTKRFIQLGTTELDKFEYYGYGVILIKSDSSLVEGGIMTDMDYFQLISDFFN